MSAIAFERLQVLQEPRPVAQQLEGWRQGRQRPSKGSGIRWVLPVVTSLRRMSQIDQTYQ